MDELLNLIGIDDTQKKYPTKRKEVEFEGVRFAEEFFSKKLNWVFIENHQENDYGIDAYAEEVLNDSVTGRMLGMQVKTGKSYVKINSNNTITYLGKIEHLNYWINHSLPVLLILCDPDEKVCYWKQIVKEHVKMTEKCWTIEIDTNNKLTEDKLDELRKIAQKPVYQKRLDSLVFAKPWMDEIINENQIILEAAEWINKSDGRGDIRILIKDLSGKEEIKLASKIRVPFTDYGSMFPKLFPWANISVDGTYYYEYDYNVFFTDNSYKDTDNNEWIEAPYFDDDFNIYLEGLPKIRPYIVESGEVARYRLLLDLNDFGKSFFNVDSYLRNENNTIFNMVDKSISDNEAVIQVPEYKKMLKELDEAIVELELFNINRAYSYKDNENKITKLINTIKNLTKGIEDYHKYCEWNYSQPQNVLLDHMKKEIIRILVCLKEKAEFSSYFIDEVIYTNYTENKCEILETRNNLIKMIDEIYNIDQEISIGYLKQGIIKRSLDDKYREYNYNDSFFSDDGINAFISIEKDCPELNAEKENISALLDRENTLENNLYECILKFFNFYLEALIRLKDIEI